MASIKDIAKMCGVSVATVSKALNDKDDIGQETKQHIKDVAKEMGYVPQYYARAIRMNKSFNIGVLFVDGALSGLTHDYFARILNSFKVTAEAKGYDITFINSDKRHNKQKTFLEHCRYRGLDGVVIACMNFFNPEVIELVNSDVPVVTIDHKFENHVCVSSNNTSGMEELVEYIISMGHERIAYISGDPSSVTSLRIESFERVMNKHGIPVRPEYQFSTEYRNLKMARQYTAELLDLDEPPTCIIYSDDYSALGGIGEIQDRGMTIPDDISVAGYDDLFLAGQLRPRLTTVHQQTDLIGQRAAEELINLIEKEKAVSEQSIVVNTTLKTGQSILKIK